MIDTCHGHRQTVSKTLFFRGFTSTVREKKKQYKVGQQVFSCMKNAQADYFRHDCLVFYYNLEIAMFISHAIGNINSNINNYDNVAIITKYTC